MEFKIKAIETKVNAVEQELGIIWDNCRTRFDEIIRKEDKILLEIKELSNKVNYLLSEKTNHGVNKDD